MKKILWKLLEMVDSNWGYTTPLQKRFQHGDKCKISHLKTTETKFNVGEIVFIIETGRHDYLVQNEDGVKGVVYQFELD
jgi:hypothetical protein